MSITASYEEIPDTLKQYLRRELYERRAISQGMKELLVNSGLGDTHRLIGACERYWISLSRSSGLCEEWELAGLHPINLEWQACSVIGAMANVYRCLIDAPQFASAPRGKEGWNTQDKVVEVLSNSELGSKYRLLTNEEILLAEYGTHGRYRLNFGYIQFLQERDSPPFWETVDSTLGYANSYNYYRVPIDVPFLMPTGMPATGDDEISEDILRFSFFMRFPAQEEDNEETVPATPHNGCACNSKFYNKVESEVAAEATWPLNETLIRSYLAPLAVVNFLNSREKEGSLTGTSLFDFWHAILAGLSVMKHITGIHERCVNAAERNFLIAANATLEHIEYTIVRAIRACGGAVPWSRILGFMWAVGKFGRDLNMKMHDFEEDHARDEPRIYSKEEQKLAQTMIDWNYGAIIRLRDFNLQWTKVYSAEFKVFEEFTCPEGKRLVELISKLSCFENDIHPPPKNLK